MCEEICICLKCKHCGSEECGIPTKRITQCLDFVCIKDGVKSFFDVCYTMQLGCGRDIWRITGKVNGKYCYPSSPVEFNEKDGIFKTVSGSVYKIMNYKQDPGKFIEQIKKDIEKKGFETI